MLIVDMLADYLASKGYGTVGTNIYVENLPATNNNVDIALFSTGGVEPINGKIYRPTTIQIRTRSSNVATAYNTLEAIFLDIQDESSLTLSGTFVIRIRALQSAPLNIGRDANNKQEYTLNFVVTISS